MLSPSLFHMIIRKDRKSVIFTTKFAFKLGHQKALRFRQNLKFLLPSTEQAPR